jgi:predicted transcriptional regulator of viral defense system
MQLYNNKQQGKAPLPEGLPPLYPEKLTRAGAFLAERLERAGAPVLTPVALFREIARMFREARDRRLYLRSDQPGLADYNRLKSNLKKTGHLTADRDYGARMMRVVNVSDAPAETIVCLLDPTCYVSHLSAMQRWGLSNRSPEALLLTRPDRAQARAMLDAQMANWNAQGEDIPFPLTIIAHPSSVRHRPLTMYETSHAGRHVTTRTDQVRVSTIGQTFLEMVQTPEFCGGMAHVLEVWTTHAETYLVEIVDAVEGAASALAKSRAGYILQERLGLVHPHIERWKTFGQRGGSRKLDPSKPFASTFSETWMLSLNV